MNNNLKPSEKICSPFIYYCQKVIPLAFDESMSYYEQLCNLVYYLKNTVMSAVNNNADALTEVQEAFKQLENYVTHYFDNLDVQTEINNKLDEMAESGELTDIIAQYLQLTGILVYNSVQDMKNATNLVNGSFAQTYGFYEIGDGGNAKYKVRNVSNQDDINDVTIIALNNPNLVAELVITNDSVNAEVFGVKHNNIDDDRHYLQIAIDYLSLYNKKLVLNNTYLLKSKTDVNILNLKPNVSIIGKGILKVNDNFGEYKSVINFVGEINNVCLKDFTIEQNTTNNENLTTTGNNNDLRIAIFGWQHGGTKNLIIENITINDCIGKWQVSIGWENAKNIIFRNNIINYNNTLDNVNYDRTSLYIACENCLIEKNIFNGSKNALTCIETHGKNYSVIDNIINNYQSGVFIENDRQIVSDNLGTIEICNNKIDNSNHGDGISLWAVQENVNIDNILIHDNTIKVKNGVFYLYPVNANAIINNIKFYNNYCYQELSNKNMFEFTNTEEIERTTNIKFLDIYNNTLSGNCLTLILLSSTNTSRFKISNFLFHNNIGDINVTERLLNVVTRSYSFPTIKFYENKFSNLSNLQTYVACYQTDNEFNNPIDFVNNELSKDLEPNLMLTGSSDIVKMIHKFKNLNLTRYWDTLGQYTYSRFLNGTILYDDTQEFKKINNQMVTNISNASANHKWLFKGSLLSNIVDSNELFYKVTKQGYKADHVLGVGTNIQGEYVQYGIYVYYVNITNNLTELDNTNFTYLDEACNIEAL